MVVNTGGRNMQNGVQLSQVIRTKTAEFKRLAEGIDENTATRTPSGRWSPKQIVSHLCGPEGLGHTPVIKAFIEKDMPRIDIIAEDPFFTENRSRMTLSQLLSEFEGEYGRISDLLAQLSQEQLNRKAHIPLFKNAPMGEYPTLADFVSGLEWHIGFHIDHMREILKALGAS